MAKKNSRKVYVKDGYYHIYNRGVEKRNIFEDEKDYKVFLGYLKQYLSPIPDLGKSAKKKKEYLQNPVLLVNPRVPKNYHGKIELVAFCLMPNHFHLLIKQDDEKAMKEFLHSLTIRYSMYFNRRHDRVGPLFQGRYKAALVKNDNYLVYLTCYIHANPIDLTSDLSNWYSSYSDYLGTTNTKWLAKDVVLKLFENEVGPDFSKTNTYKAFVELNSGRSGEIIESLTLE
jgi:putative transposase